MTIYDHLWIFTYVYHLWKVIWDGLDFGFYHMIFRARGFFVVEKGHRGVNLNQLREVSIVHVWLVVSNHGILFSISYGMSSETHWRSPWFYQRGWNHQPDV